MKDNLLAKFLSSFDFDFKLAKYDVEACNVWLEMLIKKKIIAKQKIKKLLKYLKYLKKHPYKIIPSEDIHYAIEKTLEKMLARDKDLVGIIRTARSRNDLVVSDERMYLKEKIEGIILSLKNLVLSIANLAEKNLDIAMVGYTHLQPAQPVLFSHYILSYAWWFLRDIERLNDCKKRVDVSVLGSAAFAGSSFDIDRKEVAKKLGFSKISDNSVDAVSDRDFIVEFIACCSIVMMHLSRVAEDFILWCSPNFGYIKLPKELTSGSSIMPQKQNPDYLELIRGKTAKVYSDLLGILVLMKALPLSYNRDMQEDKVYLFSCVRTVEDCLSIMRIIFNNVKINKERLEEDINRYDFVFATEIANFLVKEFKYPFKLAHKKTQSLLEYCLKNNKKLKQLEFKDYKKVLGSSFSMKSFDKLKQQLDLKNIIYGYKTYGGSSKKEVMLQIKNIRKLLK